MAGLEQAVKDPEFLKASVPDQMAYLAHVDPDFAKAGSDDKLAYLNHVTGKAPPTTANNQAENASAKEGGWGEFGKGMLKAPLQAVDATAQLVNKIPKVGETLAPKQGVDALHQMAAPSNESQQIGSTAAQRLATWVPIGAEAGAAGAAGKLLPFAKRAATTAVGGLAGSQLGKYGGKMVGIPEIGEAVGGLAGSLAGGGAFGEGARKIGNPSELPVIGKYLPDLLGETPKVMPTVSPEPYSLTPPPQTSEPPVQDTLHFPKQESPVVSTGPFKLESPAAVREPPVQASFPRVGPLETSAPPQAKAPELAPMNQTAAPSVQPISRPVETHPFAPPENPIRADGKLAFDPMTAEFPLQRSSADNPAWSRVAGNQEELEAAARRQHEYVNGEKFAKASEDDSELVREAKKWTNNVENEGTKGSNGSVQRAYKSLIGDDVHITANTKIKQPGTMSRIEAMNTLMAKGYTPAEIAKAARTPAQ
jgi:hypothetical protein